MLAAVSSPAGLKRRRLWWLLPALALGVATGLLFSTPHAGAHALLDHADPPEDSKLQQPPSQLTLYFAQALVPASSWIQLRDSGDNDLPVQFAFDPSDHKIMRASLPPLAPDVYTVKWQTLSADDDDYAHGSYSLTVLKPDGGLPGTARSGGQAGGGSKLIYALGGAIALAVAGEGVVVLRRRGAA